MNIFKQGIAKILFIVVMTDQNLSLSHKCEKGKRGRDKRYPLFAFNLRDKDRF